MLPWHTGRKNNFAFLSFWWSSNQLENPFEANNSVFELKRSCSNFYQNWNIFANNWKNKFLKQKCKKIGWGWYLQPITRWGPPRWAQNIDFWTSVFFVYLDKQHGWEVIDLKRTRPKVLWVKLPARGWKDSWPVTCFLGILGGKKFCFPSILVVLQPLGKPIWGQ